MRDHDGNRSHEPRPRKRNSLAQRRAIAKHAESAGPAPYFDVVSAEESAQRGDGAEPAQFYTLKVQQKLVVTIVVQRRAITKLAILYHVGYVDINDFKLICSAGRFI